jgi:hypothetical protein
MKFFFLFLIFISLNLHAETYRAFCSGNRGQVGVSIYSSSDADGSNKKITLRYENNLGSDDFPYYEGIVTKLAVPYIEVAKKDLSVLDHEVVVTWPMEKCQFSEEQPLLIQCHGEGEVLIPKDSNLKGTSLSMAYVTEENLTATFNSIKMRWGIDSPNYHHSLGLPFDPKTCQAEYKK